MPVMIDIEVLTDKQIVDEYRRRMGLRKENRCTRCGKQNREKTYASNRCECSPLVGMFRNCYGTPQYTGHA